jgi:hypothetical protein
MAKETQEKLTKAQLLGFKVDAATWDETPGELYAGKNVLKLTPGEIAGPFVLKTILKDQDLTPAKAKKKMEPVDVYVATHTASNMDVNMPIAAAFVQKAKDSNLSIGDTFLVRRVEDYVSKAFGTKGAGYELKITARAAAPSGKSRKAS